MAIQTTTSATLASALAPAAVDFATLERRYEPLLELVRRLIGVVPNCDPLLEIWPTGFRTYNVLVPNLLNLPFLLFGAGPPKDVVGLAAYAASRAAGCAYCSAHTCSFALRRGASPEQVAAAYGGDSDAPLSDAARAAIVTAVALSQVPSTFGAPERAALERHFSPARAEGIALAVAMMGFLNKFMDAAGVPLEAKTAGEVAGVIGPSGWTPGKHGAGSAPPRSAPRADTLWITLGALRYAPRALRLDRGWTAGVPSGWPAAGAYLREHTGHDFPLLGRLRHGRARRAIATVLRDNLDPAGSRLGLPTKLLAGLVYATVAADEQLAAESRRLAAHAGVPAATLDDVARFAASGEPEARPDLEEPAATALLLAKGAAFSPARVSPTLIARSLERLPPETIVELLVWLSVQQSLHRLGTFLRA